MYEADLETEARVQFFADTLGLEPPRQLVAEDGATTDELIHFCREMGVSLTWAFRRDLRPKTPRDLKGAERVRASREHG